MPGNVIPHLDSQDRSKAEGTNPMTNRCETCRAFVAPERPDKPTLCVPGRLRVHAVPFFVGPHHVRAEQGESCQTWEAKENDAMTITRDEAIAAFKELVSQHDCTLCRHEDTHRGGAIWTICDGCNRRWADDEGGFVPFSEPAYLRRAIEAIAVLTPEPGADRVEAALDARRYRRLRILGAAPAYTNHLRNGNVMRFNNLDTFIDDDIEAYPSRGEAEEVLSSTRQTRQPEGQGDCIAAVPEDKWIEWRGGVCPVPEGTSIYIRNRFGQEIGPTNTLWDWRHIGTDGDIIAYRVVPDPSATAPEPTDTTRPTLEARIAALEDRPVWTAAKEALLSRVAEITQGHCNRSDNWSELAGLHSAAFRKTPNAG